jgi:hypothetical protein
VKSVKIPECMEILNYETVQEEKPPVDINQPGVLVTGIETVSLEVLNQILMEGLKPRNEQSNPKKGYTVAPDWVSLSMVGIQGYKKTAAAFLWGANEHEFNSSLSLVIDPSYVEAHADEFKAVGGVFDPAKSIRKDFSDPDGKILNGLQYVSGWKGVYADEVHARHVAPEAIVGIIANSRFVGSLKDNIRNAFVERKITIYDVEGNIQK